MQARGPLMVEHRLIEKMLAVIQRAPTRVSQTRSIDPHLIDVIVDFFQVYADRLHHGKEENILFKELRKKGLSAEDERLMNELIDEHAVARQAINALAEANARYREKAGAELAGVTARLNTIADLYPRHITKEDKVFFPAAQAYFSEEENQAMIAEFWEFDRKIIHEKYRAVIKGLEEA
jgi:hemerythrin-like domain-containing protein